MGSASRFGYAWVVDLIRVSEGPTHTFVGVGNVLISLYWGSPGAEALREREGWVREAVARHGKIGLLVVVTAEAAGQLPGKDFRDVSRAQADRYRDAIAFSASVIEGAHVQHALIRTFLRGLAVVAGRGVAVRFFEDVSDGCAWAAEQAAPHGGPSAATLRRVVSVLRADARAGESAETG